jgi:hypothetical protein
MTGTGIVTVAGVAAGVGVGVGVAVAVGVEAPPCPPPLAGEGNGALLAVDFGSDVSRADAAVRVRTAPATATPPAARNCRLVATTDRM